MRIVSFYRSTTASRTIREFCEAVHFTGRLSAPQLVTTSRLGLIHPEWSEPEMLLFKGYGLRALPGATDGHRQSTQNEQMRWLGLDLLQQGHRQDGDTRNKVRRTVGRG